MTGDTPTILSARLSPEHLAALRASGISDDVIADRGYATVTVRARLGEFGFGRAQQRVPALLIPLHSVHGEMASYQCRPDAPRMRKGRTIKYETPKGSGMILDVPRRARQWLGDPARPLFITEGAKKADSAASRELCCIALLGVWNWRGTNPKGGKTVLADFEAVALNGRRVYLAFDSDATEKVGVRMALGRLAAFLQGRGADVRIIHLPPGEGGAKTGLDDYLAAGHGVEELLGLASEELPAVGDEGGPYSATDRGMSWLRLTSDGPVEVPLANFTASIQRDVLQDDGVEARRLFEIAAELLGRTHRFRVLADRFASMQWVAEHLGARALVYPGFGVRDHLRAAIQSLSEPETGTTYAHTGWRCIDGRHVYLHGGGAIGEAGAVGDVEVELPEVLLPCTLPAPPSGEELRQAVRASLRLLDVGPEELAFPLLAATYRAALGSTDYSLFVTGETGCLKTAVAAVLQQHYGAGFDARHLPGSWSSTDNALEDVAFTGQDMLLVVDDFVSQPADAGRLHARAERVLRAQGNRSARLRMRADGSLRPPRPPRGLILSTGEDVPRGHSLRARSLILQVGRGDVDLGVLTELQRLGRDGRLCAAMAGFLRWVAARFDRVQRDVARLQAELRDLAHGLGHRRTAELVASLGAGLRVFQQFAEECGAIDAETAARLRDRGWAALLAAGEAQAEHHAQAEPAGQFVRLLAAVLQSGRAHLAAVHGGEPPEPERWGWRWEWIGPAMAGAGRWRPQGDLIGWLDDQEVLLLSEPAYAACTRLARDQAEGGLPCSLPTLRRRLHERGLLASVETEGRWTRLEVRRRVGGQRVRVCHLHSATLSPDSLGQLGPAAATPSESDGCAGPGAEERLGPLGHVLGPLGPELGPAKGSSSNDLRRLGPVGPGGGTGETPELTCNTHTLAELREELVLLAGPEHAAAVCGRLRALADAAQPGPAEELLRAHWTAAVEGRTLPLEG